MASWPLPQTCPQWRWGHPLTTTSASGSRHLRRLKSKLSPLRISGYGTAGRGWPDGSTTACPATHHAHPSTVHLLVVTHQPLYPSSLRPPAAGNEYIHKLRHAVHIAHCAVWEYCCHAMRFVILGRSGIPGMMLVHSRFL